MNGPSAKISAQAKLNLHLRVLSRDATGYHSIETVFHRIDFADELTISIPEDSRRTLDVRQSPAIGGNPGPTESNLAWRAAVAYCERAEWPTGFTIELDKRIPIGAGLGGGSADAAAVLRVLNFFAPNPMDPLELSTLAATLGADVPFLVSDAVMALGSGRGDEILLLPPLLQSDVLLLTPDFKIGTADAYRWLDEDRASSGVSSTGSEETPFRGAADRFMSWNGVAAHSRNDFIDPVSARHPRLLGLLSILERTVPMLCSMTGSGSTLFGVYDGPVEQVQFEMPRDAERVRTRTSVEVVQPIRIG
jgi:4-diphosphocytidyl-2-C-methyl-D-erythritol kinase